MDEVFVERIIKRRLSLKGLMVRVLAVFLTVILGMFASLLLGLMFGLLITFLLAYLANICWAYTSVVYEYSFLNGELTVDKILGQRKRKNVDNYDIKKAEVIAPANSDDIMRRGDNLIKKDYSSGYKSDELYAMVINNGQGNVMVMFEPNEKMVDAMYHVRPNIVKKNRY